MECIGKMLKLLILVDGMSTGGLGGGGGQRPVKSSISPCGK